MGFNFVELEKFSIYQLEQYEKFCQDYNVSQIDEDNDTSNGFIAQHIEKENNLFSIPDNLFSNTNNKDENENESKRSGIKSLDSKFDIFNIDETLEETKNNLDPNMHIKIEFNEKLGLDLNPNLRLENSINDR